MITHLKATIYSIIAIVIALSPIDVYPISESSHQPIISATGWFIDPTSRDLTYLNMPIKVKGDYIIEYETPFMHEVVKCNIPYRQMTEQERRQMDFTDSQGRSYELYVGDVKYVAKLGKLTVYFADWGFSKMKLYSQTEVDKKSASRIEDFIKSSIKSRDDNPNPWVKMVISFIVNRDGVISDVEILETPDKSLGNQVLNWLKRLKIEPAHVLDRHLIPRDVDCKFKIELSVKPNLTKKQVLDKCVQYWNEYFSKQKDAIESAKKITGYTQEKPSPKIPNRLNDLYTFIDDLPLSKIINGYNVNIKNGYNTVYRWEQIRDNIFKYNKSNKRDNLKGIYIESKRGGYDRVLKHKEDEEAIQYLLNKLNDMLYYRIIESAFWDEYRTIDFYVPRNLNDLAKVVSKEQSKKDFLKFFKRDSPVHPGTTIGNSYYSYNIDDLIREPEIKKYYSQWEENYYLDELSKFRNVILNKEKTKVIGRYYINDYDFRNRAIFFNNEKPYMLYPFQENSQGYRWTHLVNVSRVY